MDDTGDRCKCCGAATAPFAAIDFSRTCLAPAEQPFPPSGQLVPYRRCRACGFIFTTFFDAWPPSRMAGQIYNADYRLADPEFVTIRPAHFAEVLSSWLAPMRSTIRVLDHGGGEGTLAALMRGRGFQFDSHDPYFSNSPPPSDRYHLVTCFEVVEHSADPAGTFAAILPFLEPDGAILFSTSLQPRGVTGDWPYIAPRNGHISIHTARSLQHLAARFGMTVLSVRHMHLMFRRAIDPAARLLLGGNVYDLLWQASRQNARALITAALTAARIGHPLAALDPRHPARLLLGERR